MHRKQLRLKQRHVAELLGLQSTTQLLLWEKGIALPNSYNLIKLSVIYKTLPNELYWDLYQELREEIMVKELELFKRI